MPTFQFVTKQLKGAHCRVLWEGPLWNSGLCQQNQVTTFDENIFKIHAKLRSNIRTIKSRRTFPLKQNNVDLPDPEPQVSDKKDQNFVNMSDLRLWVDCEKETREDVDSFDINHLLQLQTSTSLDEKESKSSKLLKSVVKKSSSTSSSATAGAKSLAQAADLASRPRWCCWWWWWWNWTWWLAIVEKMYFKLSMLSSPEPKRERKFPRRTAKTQKK